VRLASSGSSGKGSRSAFQTGLAATGCAVAGFACASSVNECDGSKHRIISLAELRDQDQACWVSYKGGVYDVTEFLDAHPGGPHR
jgi:hypothetical protein